MEITEGFQNLKVWQKAHFLTLNIYKATRFFPDDERYGLTNQVRRSAVSVCANIVEGYKKSKKDFMRYIGIAQASLEETKYHLILSRDLDYISKAAFIEFFALANEIGKMLNGLKKTLN
jgi:four helix bundle protein